MFELVPIQLHGWLIRIQTRQTGEDQFVIALSCSELLFLDMKHDKKKIVRKKYKLFITQNSGWK